MSGHYLSTPLRRALEKSIRSARHVAEDGARDAIRRLGVADPKPPAYLGDREKDLRRRLRAHARALGDAFDKAGDKQETRKLVEATAYAHWHRMLFARFLAERNLLRHPTLNAPITIEECRELAAEEGLQDAWAVAERYAAAMLPAVFRIDDPVLLIDLDPAHTQKLTALVTGLDRDTFQAEDSLGWTYQYWRAAEKEAVNESGVKIGADELPAVTQLFTEPYMVRFLLHNTLGAWWAGKCLAADPQLAATAKDEDELRASCSLPTYAFDMLRFDREANDGLWRPSAGTYPGWPTNAFEITVLDPCCGSGHFLTEALSILAALRQHEEGLSPSNSVLSVLRHNLFGLEIDGRCVQIAAFALALNAWLIGGWQALPAPHLAWVGTPPALQKREFVALAGGSGELGAALATLHDIFQKAPVLGSLLEPVGGDLVDPARIARIETLLEPLLSRIKTTEPDDIEALYAARGMTDAFAILANRFTLQATNVPYLGRGKQGDILAAYASARYPDAKNDLAAVFMSRLQKLMAAGGTLACVSPQSVLFLGRYKRLRLELATHYRIDCVAALGARAFEAISGEVVNTALLILSASGPQVLDFCSIDLNNANNPKEKAIGLQSAELRRTPTAAIFSDPEHRISANPEAQTGVLLRDIASVLVGVTTGDAQRFIFKFWEWSRKEDAWEFFQTTADSPAPYSGMTDSILWQKEVGALADFANSVKHLNHIAQNWRRGKPNWGRAGVSVSMMTDLRASIYTGERYDSNCCAIVPHDDRDVEALWAYCRSEEFFKTIRSVNRSLKIEVGTILSSSINISYWRRKVSEATADTTLPEPHSSDPKQWIFTGHPREATSSFQLHTALCRLCGFSWPAETNSDLVGAVGRNWLSRTACLPSGDEDGLLALPSVGGEVGLADRLRSFLRSCYGADWVDGTEQELVASADAYFETSAMKERTLEGWLRDRAFRQHSMMFHHRPFLWHISDGLKDGFSVFAHYHRFDQAALRKLTYTILGDWLARAKHEKNDLRYEKGRELQQKLEKILEGEKPYDIFVRWKSLAEQPLGWDPDLKDGVRLNIRPFVEAGVLRDTPKIKWTKDRGSDVASAPWYDLGPKSGGKPGDRINDHHTTLAEKRAAREAAKSTSGAKS